MANCRRSFVFAQPHTKLGKGVVVGFGAPRRNRRYAVHLVERGCVTPLPPVLPSIREPDAFDPYNDGSAPRQA